MTISILFSSHILHLKPLFLQTIACIKLDLRIGELMQICIHRKDNPPKPVNHRLNNKGYIGTFEVRYVGYFGTPWMTLN